MIVSRAKHISRYVTRNWLILYTVYVAIYKTITNTSTSVLMAPVPVKIIHNRLQNIKISLGVLSGLLPWDFPTIFLSLFFRIKCPAQAILHAFIALMICCEGYKLWSVSFYKFLHPPVASLLIALNLLLGSSFSEPSIWVLQVRGKQHIRIMLI
jgi:hypothetical protein